MRAVFIRFVVCRQLRACDRWPKIAKMINLPMRGDVAFHAFLWSQKTGMTDLST
jgi:hypothetical protein